MTGEQVSTKGDAGHGDRNFHGVLNEHQLAVVGLPDRHLHAIGQFRKQGCDTGLGKNGIGNGFGKL